MAALALAALQRASNNSEASNLLPSQLDEVLSSQPGEGSQAQAVQNMLRRNLAKLRDIVLCPNDLGAIGSAIDFGYAQRDVERNMSTQSGEFEQGAKDSDASVAPRGVSARESRQATTLLTILGLDQKAIGVLPHFSSILVKAELQVRCVLGDKAFQSGLLGHHRRITPASVSARAMLETFCASESRASAAASNLGRPDPFDCMICGPPRQA